jgi:hypothetical protein
MSPSPPDRLRRLAGSAAALLAAAGHAGTAHGGAAAPQITVVGDSVVVSGLAAGRATLRVTRPDARTKAPVVIGEFSGPVSDSLPFAVNTTVPDPLYAAAGDCWQAGALHLPGGAGLTPDIRPGDTVALVGGPSLKVTRGGGTVRGPIAGCAPTSVFAENAVTGAPSSVGNTKLVVSGVAQPLTTGVSVSVSDGSRSTSWVDVVPRAGRWRATIPAAQVRRLAKGTLTVTAVFAVPDVSTGAAAHIAGTVRTLQKSVGPSRSPVEVRGRRRATGRTPTPRAGPVRVYARREAAARGWTGAHWSALEEIVRPESGWDPCAVFPQRHRCAYAGAGSCGLPQAQPCPAAWRGRLWEVRFAQVRWLLDYIAGRYGNPQSALRFRQAHSWY